jgi:dihydroxyacid dehydratase/phosphogluconate dehydratase
MLSDRYLKPGEPSRAVGAGTHTRMFWDEYQAGNLDAAELQHLESRMTRAPGTCNTMGTASTMTAIAEALGLTLPGASSIPAMDSAHSRMATSCGERMVGMVWEDLRAHRLWSRAARSRTHWRCKWRWAAPPTQPCTLLPWPGGWASV